MDLKEQSKQKIYDYFKSLCLDYSIIILDNYTIEMDDLYVFYYDSKEYIVDGNPSYALAGNSGIIVDKTNLELYTTSNTIPIEDYIRLFKTDKSKLQKME